MSSPPEEVSAPPAMEDRLPAPTLPVTKIPPPTPLVPVMLRIEPVATFRLPEPVVLKRSVLREAAPEVFV